MQHNKERLGKLGLLVNLNNLFISAFSLFHSSRLFFFYFVQLVFHQEKKSSAEKTKGKSEKKVR